MRHVRDLKQIIQSGPLSIAEIAIKSGVSKTAIESWVSGKINPTVPNLEAVLNTLGYELVAVPVSNQDINQTTSKGRS